MSFVWKIVVYKSLASCAESRAICPRPVRHSPALAHTHLMPAARLA